MWFVYILECENDDFYTGMTNNLDRRLKEHQSGQGGKFTRSFKVRCLVYSEECLDKSAALKREWQIKGWTRKKKLGLIQTKKKHDVSKR